MSAHDVLSWDSQRRRKRIWARRQGFTTQRWPSWACDWKSVQSGRCDFHDSNSCKAGRGDAAALCAAKKQQQTQNVRSSFRPAEMSEAAGRHTTEATVTGIKHMLGAAGTGVPRKVFALRFRMTMFAELGEAAGLYTAEAVIMGVVLTLAAAGGWSLGVVGPHAPGLPEEGQYLKRLKERRCGAFSGSSVCIFL